MVVSLQSRSQDQCHFPGKDTVEFYENDTKQLFSVYKIGLIPVSKPLAYQERLFDETSLSRKQR